MKKPVTPDGRYFVVRGRLWRCTNPALDEPTRTMLTRDLMTARRAKQDAMRKDDAMAHNTPYATWFANLPAETESRSKTNADTIG